MIKPYLQVFLVNRWISEASSVSILGVSNAPRVQNDKQEYLTQYFQHILVDHRLYSYKKIHSHPFQLPLLQMIPQKLSHIPPVFSHPKQDLYHPSTKKTTCHTHTLYPLQDYEKVSGGSPVKPRKKQTHHTKRHLETEIRIAFFFPPHV